MGAKLNICVLSSGARQGYIVKYRVIKARGLGEIHVGGGGYPPTPLPQRKNMLTILYVVQYTCTTLPIGTV